MKKVDEFIKEMIFIWNYKHHPERFFTGYDEFGNPKFDFTKINYKAKKELRKSLRRLS